MENNRHLWLLFNFVGKEYHNGPITLSISVFLSSKTITFTHSVMRKISRYVSQPPKHIYLFGVFGVKVIVLLKRKIEIERVIRPL
jgi:hypothetical protein